MKFANCKKNKNRKVSKISSGKKGATKRLFHPVLAIIWLNLKKMAKVEYFMYFIELSLKTKPKRLS